MTSPAEATTLIQEHAARLPTVARALADLTGAILRETIVASRDQPPFDRVTMDGIAFDSKAGRREFRIAGTQAAGARPMILANKDACFEVMTGAMLPAGCDCVVPVEKISIAEGIATLGTDVSPLSGLNVHARGVDCAAGTILLEAGLRLGAPEVAVIASTGLARVSVAQSPRITVISTGDELIEPGDAVADWQIYRSNAYAVLTALHRHGYHDVSHDHVPDELPMLRQRLAKHLEDNDVLVLSGGVSMGKFDYIPQVLGELGIRMVFHKIEQRPGRPMWFGVGGGKTAYALPGNPVSTLVCLIRYVLPGLAAAEQRQLRTAERVRMESDTESRVPLTAFLPVRLLLDDQGTLRAQSRPTKGSGDFTSLLGTDGFVELPPGPTVVTRGSSIPLYRWE